MGDDLVFLALRMKDPTSGKKTGLAHRAWTVNLLFSDHIYFLDQHSPQETAMATCPLVLPVHCQDLLGKLLSILSWYIYTWRADQTVFDHLTFWFLPRPLLTLLYKVPNAIWPQNWSGHSTWVDSDCNKYE